MTSTARSAVSADVVVRVATTDEEALSTAALLKASPLSADRSLESLEADNRAGLKTDSLHVATTADGKQILGVALWGAITQNHGRYLRRLFVDEAHRSRGVGEKLVRFGFEQTLKQGLERVSLATEKSNVRAQAFYSRLGFTRFGEKPTDASKWTYHIGLTPRAQLALAEEIRAQAAQQREAKSAVAVDGIVCRVATMDDEEQCTAALRKHYTTRLSLDRDSEYLEADITAGLKSESLYVATTADDGKRIVGVALWGEVQPRHGRYLHRLFVDEAYRGRDVLEKLCNFGEDREKERGGETTRVKLRVATQPWEAEAATALLHGCPLWAERTRESLHADNEAALRTGDLHIAVERTHTRSQDARHPWSSTSSERVVGLALWDPRDMGPGRYLRRLVVEEKLRSLGFGEQLVEFGVRQSRDRGLARAWLTTGVNNERAQRFYARLGWSRAYQVCFKPGDHPQWTYHLGLTGDGQAGVRKDVQDELDRVTRLKQHATVARRGAFVLVAALVVAAVGRFVVRSKR